MKPEKRATTLLGITRSKAKMYEYNVPESYHIDITRDPARLFDLTLGLLGDYSAQYYNNENGPSGELSRNLLFSARFFDAYRLSRLDEKLYPYLALVGSATYYLCDLAGSSQVLSKLIGEDSPNMECEGLEDLFLWLLQGNYSTVFSGSEGLYGKVIDDISSCVVNYFENGEESEQVFEHTNGLRQIAYADGTPRQLLFADIISAVTKRRIANSTWYCLPRYTDLSVDVWSQYLQKESFIKELWPAQHLLGEHDTLRGKSAVVQMPTSAGKTKAIELILRSSFLSGRASFAVIIAPFRALCNEITSTLDSAFSGEGITINESSDVLQSDYNLDELISGDQILVVTPEKFLYMLRLTPDIASYIGLIIYDEGHQFDSGVRGITYELLLSALKKKLPENIQTVLASAVISNAESINDWLIDADSDVIEGTNLIPTFKTIAFAYWPYRLGRIEYVNDSNINTHEFFVPRVIESVELNLRPRERKIREFPTKDDSQSIALYLGLKLVGEGAVAIFCGRKMSVTKICEMTIDAYDRGLELERPIENSNAAEVAKLHYLHECNLGENAVETKCSAMGIFSHHGNTPHGIRLAIEYSMKEDDIRFVVCTSTLAQGVNLPIRYLLVTSIYQGADQIKVRDFHNLIGRAGRSGMHTEGSIIFSDPRIYAKKGSRKDGWRWKQTKKLLEPKNSEPCGSTLFSLFTPIESYDKKTYLDTEPLWFISAYIEGESELNRLVDEIVTEHGDKGFTANSLKQQFEWRLNLISSIESYLMASLEDAESSVDLDNVSELAQDTLAYFLATDEQKEHIVETFTLLAKNIEDKVPDFHRRVIYSKTLYGVRLSQEIESWVTGHIGELKTAEDIDDLLEVLWPIITNVVQNKLFRNCEPQSVLLELGTGWIHGQPFHALFDIIKESNAVNRAGTKRRQFKLDHVVEICENGLSYDGALVIGAIIELVDMLDSEDSEDLIADLQILQKRIKYGLSNIQEIILYEMGFADRCVATELAGFLGDQIYYRNDMLVSLRQNADDVVELLSKYPAYFTSVWNKLSA